MTIECSAFDCKAEAVNRVVSLSEAYARFPALVALCSHHYARVIEQFNVRVGT